MTKAADCEWCGKPLYGTALRLVRGGGWMAGGVTRAQFHAACAEVVIGLCRASVELKSAPHGSVMEEAVVERKPLREPKKAIATEKPARTKGVRPTKYLMKPAYDDDPPPEPKPALRPDEVRDLAARGFGKTQIAARLRAPYREIERILEAA